MNYKRALPASGGAHQPNLALPLPQVVELGLVVLHGTSNQHIARGRSYTNIQAECLQHALGLLMA